uniref:Cof-type HAD-IIB family hydrolase n=1 Tax=Candidatus Limisoma sp. TaxID=3076476 RepID=UPI0040255CC8
MTTKALFFDIDGTLVSFNTHEISASTVDALEQAKANGLKVFIATGRPRQLINNLSAISHLIDGYVTTNGAYCYASDNNIVCNPIPEADALSIKAEADRMGAMSLVVGIDGILLCNPDIPLVDGLQKLLNVPSIPVGNDITPLLRHGIVQMTVFVSASQEPQLLAGAPSSHGSRWYPTFTDITSCKADKASGIAAMAAHFGISISETMAFGDGGNDTPMLRHAGIGVAMGNALPEVQAAADFVTTAVDNDGIAHALRHFGLI